jgi:hypothetical protein
MVNWCSGAGAVPRPCRRARWAHLLLFLFRSPRQMVFAEVALGAIVLTINVILLGGELVFFQVWARAGAAGPAAAQQTQGRGTAAEDDGLQHTPCSTRVTQWSMWDNDSDCMRTLLTSVTRGVAWRTPLPPPFPHPLPLPGGVPAGLLFVPAGGGGHHLRLD